MSVRILVEVTEEKMKTTRREVLQGAMALGAMAGIPAASAGKAERSPAVDLPRGEFHVDVDDFRMFCKVEGDGPLLIHQTGIWTFSSVAMMAPLNEAFAKHFTVLTMDCRGQGGSSLGNGPTTYTRAAADTVRLMDELGIEDAHFVGVSDGGCIQLHLLLEFEERVKSSTLIGTPYSHDAYTPEVQAGFRKWREAMLADSDVFYGIDGKPHPDEVMKTMRTGYESVSPHPEKFIEVLKGQRRSWATEPDVSLRRLTAINRPVLVVSTDADEYIPKKAFDDLEAAIPGARSVFFEGMPHNPGVHVDQIAESMVDFTGQVNS